jgi:hypothetical protein
MWKLGPPPTPWPVKKKSAPSPPFPPPGSPHMLRAMPNQSWDLGVGATNQPRGGGGCKPGQYDIGRLLKRKYILVNCCGNSNLEQVWKYANAVQYVNNTYVRTWIQANNTGTHIYSPRWMQQRSYEQYNTARSDVVLSPQDGRVI